MAKSYDESMNSEPIDQLRDAIEAFIRRNRHKPLEKLALLTDFSITTLNNIRNHEHVPLPWNAREIALKLGLSEDAAERIAQRCQEIRSRKAA